MNPVESPDPVGATERLGAADPVYSPWKRRDLEYPSHDVEVIAPETFVSSDGNTICWRGQNFVRQPDLGANACESAEGAARRYAGQLLALQKGLRERGYSLSNVCEDHIVRFVLDALDAKDEEHEAALDFNLEAVTRALAEDELMADLVASIAMQDRQGPIGLLATRDGLRLVLADLQDKWEEARQEWKFPDGTSRTGSLGRKALEMAAFSWRLARAVRAMNGEPG